MGIIYRKIVGFLLKNNFATDIPVEVAYKGREQVDRVIGQKFAFLTGKN